MSDNTTVGGIEFYQIAGDTDTDALLDRLYNQYAGGDDEPEADRDPFAATLHAGRHGVWTDTQREVVDHLVLILEAVGVEVFCDCGRDGCASGDMVAQLKSEDEATIARLKAGQ